MQCYKIETNLCKDERNSGIGQGRAKSYMAGWMEGMMSARPERAVGEGSTLFGKESASLHKLSLQLIIMPHCHNS